MKKKIFSTVGVIATAATLMMGCANGSTGSNGSSGNSSNQPSGSITAVGSTALQPLVQEAGTKYQSEHAGTTINVQGGGSGTGLSKVSEGAVDIGNSDVFAEEKEGVDASKIEDHKVAVVGMGPVVNKDAGVKNITKQQLIDIFTGKITNWKQVGGKDEKIVIINRAAGSGTRAVFEKFGLDGKTTVNAQEQDSSGTVKKIVSQTPGAISYLAFSYFDSTLKALNVDGVAPTKENVETNQWKIWAYEHMYTNGKAKGLAKDFIDYMESNEVQNSVVEDLGYISTTGMKVDRDADGKVTNK